MYVNCRGEEAPVRVFLQGAVIAGCVRDSGFPDKEYTMTVTMKSTHRERIKKFVGLS